MGIEIKLTEGPNVEGLYKDRTVLYVGYFHESEGIFWALIEGIENDNPRSYRFHAGKERILNEFKITNFEYTPDETILKFLHENNSGKIVISNRSPNGKYNFGGIENDIETVYNFFGIERASSLLPHR